MLNKKASDPKKKPDEVMKALELKQGSKVADIGSGGGYFTLRFAKTAGKGGRVFAVDTNAKLLDFINNSAKEKDLNVVTVLVEKNKPTLPGDSLDLIFMRNVCHHLTNRVEYFMQLKSALKTSGRLAIIEYNSAGHFGFHKLFKHYIPKEIIIREMREAGYQLERDLDFLPEQSFTIFGPLT